MNANYLLGLESALAADWPVPNWQEVTVVVGVSGGADSVALLRAMRALKTGGSGSLIAAHLNHALRGGEADDDERFVVALCQQLGVDCEVARAAPGEIAPHGDGWEAAARHARYEFLHRVAEQRGARYVATAHTANDQAETILHNILRGTGLAGLAGIPRVRSLGPAVSLVRPLLGVSREQVIAYLQALDQPFREDSSNADRGYLRNRIRHELLPLLERDYAPAVEKSLLRLGQLAAEAQAEIEHAAEQLLDRALTASAAGKVELDAQFLASHSSHLVREALKTVWRRQAWPMQAMGLAQWTALAEMAANMPEDPRSAGKQMFPGQVTAIRTGQRMVLSAVS